MKTMADFNDNKDKNIFDYLDENPDQLKELIRHLIEGIEFPDEKEKCLEDHLEDYISEENMIQHDYDTEKVEECLEDHLIDYIDKEDLFQYIIDDNYWFDKVLDWYFN